MNLKRWFAWLCLALMLVAEICLFAALRQKDTAQNALRETQAQLWQMQKDLDELKHSNTGLQAAEILRLRKQNEITTNLLAQAQARIEKLESDLKKTGQSLATARTALQLQQDHLQQLQSENQLVTDASITIIHRNNCINQLRQIDGAKQQWALEKNKAGDAIPRAQNLLPYLKDEIFPVCPEGGTYAIHSVDEIPTCTIQGHLLPQ
jgi:chromosome segregation ATPase